MTRSLEKAQSPARIDYYIFQNVQARPGIRTQLAQKECSRSTVYALTTASNKANQDY